MVSNGLSSLRYDKDLEGSEIQSIKHFITTIDDASKERTVSDLKALCPGVDVASITAILDKNYDHFKGLGTSLQEAAYLYQTLPTVPVIERDLGDGHIVCDLPLLSSIERHC